MMARPKENAIGFRQSTRAERGDFNDDDLNNRLLIYDADSARTRIMTRSEVASNPGAGT